MAEGDTHRQLVEQLMRMVSSKRNNTMSIYIDGKTPFLGGSPPPAIGDTRPDLYAFDGQTKHVIIGEAKSARDIDNDHTEKQILSYFEHLASCPSGELLVAVPYVCAGAAHRLCLSTRKSLRLDHIPFEINGWFLGRKPVSEVWRG